MEALLRAVSLKHYVTIAEKCGLNGLQMLRQHKITPAMIANPEQMLSYASVLQLLEDSAKASGQESFGLLMAEVRTMADWGEVSLLMSHQPTLREALHVVMDFGNLINRYFALRIEDRGRRVFLREETLADSDLPKRQAVELSTALIHQTCAAILGTQWRPKMVCFTHSKPSTLTVHERVFHSRFEFDASANGIWCDAADLDAPNPRADPAMAAIARRFMGAREVRDADDLLFNLRKATYLLLPLGKAKIKQVAPGLGMSVRNLQRQLDELGVSYSTVLNEVRKELVLGHLQNRKTSIESIAAMLGYTKATSFTRWFNTEYGVPPRNWRKEKALRSSG
ncbi:AraC family transcriptional regulator [Curvibacter sp. APW13]|uniref:AraC family transcriptional regulator n=1 Tax=Curvibacter sp. APW13 TaxID=3077236 RepID=UPI0028DE71C8|nr:AraC family transcriptional regulator [Curvibacter sp. APW13]MDT8989327.1 AraC family transcriptional regulator [Curvibacter sp. APW13]